MTPTPPRYGTPRRPDRPTDAGAAIRLARLVDREPLPWQRHVLEVAGELDAAGEHVYRFVVVSVGRRAGKSFLSFLRLIAPLITTPGYLAWYTAQDGQAVTKRWRHEWKPLVDHYLADVMRVRMSEGREALEVPRQTSSATAFAPTPTALHGVDADLVMFDEAWAHSEARGLELEQAARPTMFTRPGGQIWILSAAGAAQSTWWKQWTERGRLAAATDLGHGTAYFEWSADAAGVDRDDPDEWARSHPSIRTPANPHGRLRLEDLADERASDPAIFDRSVLNIAETSDLAADRAMIDGFAAGTRPAATLGDPVVIGVDIDHDRQWCSIVAGDHDTVEVIEHREHGPWVRPRLEAICLEHSPLAVVWDAAGPANALERDFADLAALRIAARTRDVTAAAGEFYDAAVAGNVYHRGDPDLIGAVATARRRTTSGSWVFDRRVSGAGPLVAATLARWGALNPALREPQIL